MKTSGKKLTNEQELAYKQTKKLVDILDYFSEIEKPPFTRETCPFGARHYEFSKATDGLGCWAWECPLCGKLEEE